MTDLSIMLLWESNLFRQLATALTCYQSGTLCLDSSTGPAFAFVVLAAQLMMLPAGQ